MRPNTAGKRSCTKDIISTPTAVFQLWSTAAVIRARASAPDARSYAARYDEQDTLAVNALIESARKWLTRLGITSLLLLVALGTICGIVMLRKLG